VEVRVFEPAIRTFIIAKSIYARLDLPLCVLHGDSFSISVALPKKDILNTLLIVPVSITLSK
jgi:hypothetical protein